MKTFLFALLLPFIAFAAPDAALTGSWIDYKLQTGNPANPRTGYLRSWVASDGRLFGIDAAGTIKELGGGGSSFNAISPLNYDAVSRNLSILSGSFLVPGSNLSDLGSVSTARTNLGLGSFALKNSLVSGDIPNNAANTSGNAATASALATTPAQCATGYHAQGIAANGNAQCVLDPVSGINQLTGDVTASGTGSVAATIANAAVSNAKLADLSVGTSKIQDGAATTAKIADANVTTAKLADASVTTAKIADGNVTLAKMASASVSADKLAVGAVDLATSTVTGVAPIVKGGTGSGTKAGGYDALSPNSSAGNIAIHNGTTNVAQTPPGPGQVLAGDPSAATKYSASDLAGPDTIRNIGLSVSNASNALTITVTDANGAALSASNVAKIAFAKAASNGQSVVRTITAPLTLTLPQGATIGYSYLSSAPFYVYAIDNAGVILPGVSATPLREEDNQNVLAVASNSTSQGLYSSSALTGVSVRLIGVVKVTEATPGTYVNAANYKLANTVTARTQAASITQWETPWADFPMSIAGETSAPALGATSVNKAQWRRIGPDSIEVKYDLVQTAAGTTGTGAYLFPIPSQFSIDTNKQRADSAAAGAQVGTGYISANNANGLGASSAPVTVHAWDSTRLWLTAQLAPTQGGQTQSSVNSTFFALNNSPYRLSYRATIPVTQYANSQAGTIITKDPVTLLSGQASYVASLGTNPTVGQYTSFIRAGNSNNYSASAPSALPAAGQGFRIYVANTGYAQSDTTNQPSRYDVFIGKGLNDSNWRVRWGSAAGPSGTLSTGIVINGTSTIGVQNVYDPVTGVLTIVHSIAGNATNMYTGLTAGNVSTAGGYFEVELLSNPLAAGLAQATNVVRVAGGNGQGGSSSGDTSIMNFAAVIDSRGSDAIYVPRTTTTGDQFKAGAKGEYCFTGSGGFTNATNWGLTLNGDAYTTAALAATSSIPGQFVLTNVTSPSGTGYASQVAWCGPMEAGDRLRVQSNASNAFNTTQVQPYATFYKRADGFQTPGSSSGGNVVSGSNERIERMRVSSTGVLKSQSSAWATPAAPSSAGVYALTVAAGTWANLSDVVCSCSADTRNTRYCNAVPTSTTVITVNTITDQVLTSQDFGISCQGARGSN